MAETREQERERLEAQYRAAESARQSRIHALAQSSTREQWVIGKALAAGVMAADTIYCSSGDDDPEPCNRPGYKDAVAAIVAESVSAGMCENAMIVLERAIALLEGSTPEYAASGQ